MLTFETETISLEVLAFCAQFVKVLPGLNALKVAQDRLYEKTLFNELAIPTNRFFAIDEAHHLAQAGSDIGFPSIIKTRTQGYDGKGQYVVKDAGELAEAWDKLGQLPCILESFVDYQREVSIIAVRDSHDHIEFFPLTQNFHSRGILRYSFPTEADPLQAQAEAYARTLMNHLDYVGCLAIEFFDVAGELFTNEVAPRVHNSGHWTLEGASMSQFEMHLRAISGENISTPKATQRVVMANIIGELSKPEVLSDCSNITLHDYGKTLKENRKMGHYTLSEQAGDNVLAQLGDLFEALGENEYANHIRAL